MNRGRVARRPAAGGWRLAAGVISVPPTNFAVIFYRLSRKDQSVSSLPGRKSARVHGYCHSLVECSSVQTGAVCKRSVDTGFSNDDKARAVMHWLHPSYGTDSESKAREQINGHSWSYRYEHCTVGTFT